MESPDTDFIPRVSLELVEYLEKAVLQRLPTPGDTAGMAAFIGQLTLVRQLRGIYDDQNPPRQ